LGRRTNIHKQGKSKATVVNLNIKSNNYSYLAEKLKNKLSSSKPMTGKSGTNFYHVVILDKFDKNSQKRVRMGTAPLGGRKPNKISQIMKAKELLRL
jgi:hypothetical protein